MSFPRDFVLRRDRLMRHGPSALTVASLTCSVQETASGAGLIRPSRKAYGCAASVGSAFSTAEPATSIAGATDCEQARTGSFGASHEAEGGSLLRDSRFCSSHRHGLSTLAHLNGTERVLRMCDGLPRVSGAGSGGA